METVWQPVHIVSLHSYIYKGIALGVVAEWSKVLIPVPGYFMSSFHLYISFHLTLWVACMPLESPLEYNMYLFNLQIANHMLIKIFFLKKVRLVVIQSSFPPFHNKFIT